MKKKKANIGLPVEGGPASVKPPKIKIPKNFLETSNFLQENPLDKVETFVPPQLEFEGPQLTPGSEPNFNWMDFRTPGFYPKAPSPGPLATMEMDPMQTRGQVDGEIIPIERDGSTTKATDPQPAARRGINAATVGLGLQLINEFITSDPIRKPVVRPGLVYNDRPNGTGSQAIYEDGGEIQHKGSKLELLSPIGDIEPISDSTFKFVGPSHDQGGIDIRYGKQEVEVEGDETAFLDTDGSLQIMGNMTVPGTKQKFKNATKDIARKEMKVAKEKSLAHQLMEGKDPRKSSDKLAINAATLNLSSALMKEKVLINRKSELAEMQASILKVAEQTGQDPNKIAEGRPKAKKGMKVTGDPEPDEKVAKKFAAVKDAATKKLQALYPGQKVEFVMNRERDIRTQRGLKGSGASKTSVSLHNFGGAADYTIKVDGKIVDLNTKGGLDVYKKTLHAAAKEQGMYTVGDWDPYHVGLVQEGKGKTFSSLFSQYPELKQTKRYANTVGYLKELVDKGEADATELRTYNFLTGSKATPGTKTRDYGDYKQFVLPESRKGQMVGENFFEDLPTINPTSPNSGKITQITGDGTPIGQQKADADLNVEYKGDFNITAPQSKKKGTNVEALRFAQVLPEVVAQATNKVDPVWMQQFAPEYLQPYNISLQDQMNENNASFNGLERLVDDPSSLSILAAQKYQANQKVLAEQFRINQGIEADVIGKNTGMFNDAQLKNLGLADQQYVRQETAKSKTKTLNREILNSMSAKELQHDASMKRLAVWENMYDYRFVDSNKDGLPDQAQYQGPDAQFDFFGPLGGQQKQKNTQTVTLDQYGVPIRTQKKVEDVVPQERITTTKKGKNGASIPSLYSQMMKKMR